MPDELLLLKPGEELCGRCEGSGLEADGFEPSSLREGLNWHETVCFLCKGQRKFRTCDTCGEPIISGYWRMEEPPNTDLVWQWHMTCRRPTGAGQENAPLAT